MALELFATPFFDSGGAPIAKPCYGEPTQIEVDIPLGNIDSAAVVITNTLDARPTVYVDRHPDASNPTSNAQWRHFAFAVDQLADDTPKRPIFQINRATNSTAYLWASYKATKTVDYATWVESTRWTAFGISTNGYYEWEYADVLATGRTFIHNGATARYSEITAFAATLLANANVNPSTNANASGVYATSPSATNHNGTEVGLKPQYGLNMKFGGATTDGQPKRKMVVLQGIHAAGECEQWYAFKSFVEYILNSSDIEAQNLRSNWDFYIYFCINPDGWEGGDRRGAFSYSSHTNGTFFFPAQPAWQPIEDLKSEIAADIPTFDVSVTVNWHSDVFAVNSEWVSYTAGLASAQGLGYDAVVTAGQSIFTGTQLNQTTSATDPHDMRYGIEVLGANATNPTSISNEVPAGRQSDVAFYEDIGVKWAKSYSVADQTGVFNGSGTNSTASAAGSSTASAVGQSTTQDEAVATAQGTSTAAATAQTATESEAVAVSAGSSTAAAVAGVDVISSAVATAFGAGSAIGIAQGSAAAPSAAVGSSGLFLIRNDLLSTAATLTASSTAATTDVANLKLDRKSLILRSVDTSDQVITATWATFQTLSGVGMAFSNLPVGASFRVRTYLTSGSGTPFYDSGFVPVDFAYDPPDGFTTIGYKSFAFGGGNYLSKFFDEHQGQKVEVTLRSPGNPDGAIELSRLIIGKAVNLSRGASYGANVRYVDSTDAGELTGGDRLNKPGAVRKIINFTIRHMPPADKTQWVGVSRSVGKRVPVFLSLREDTTGEERKHYQVFGTIEDDGLSRNTFDKDTVSIEAVEQ